MHLSAYVPIILAAGRQDRAGASRVGRLLSLIKDIIRDKRQGGKLRQCQSGTPTKATRGLARRDRTPQLLSHDGRGNIFDVPWCGKLFLTGTKYRLLFLSPHPGTSESPS
jgi:hypothetical protein